MVYFTCDACGEQLKKPSVEKHYTQKCRECWKLTCIDCLKDFFGDEYKSHNACMSEDQRYSKEGRSGWDPTQGSGHKGEKKQNVWVNNLRAILAEATDLDGDVRNIVNTIMDHENIPRKQAKFVNFVKNIMRNKARPHSIDKTWDLFSQALKPATSEEKKEEEVKMETDEKKEEVKGPLENEIKVKSEKEKKKKKQKEEPTEEDTSEKENVQKETKKSKKSKKSKEEIVDDKPKNLKRKREEGMDVDKTIESEETPEKKTKFDWDETISTLLKQKGNEMKLNKLKKKCVAEFMAQHEGTHMTEEKVGAKFDKKLKKRKYRVLKDKVKLITEEKEEVAEKPEESKPEVTEAKKTETFAAKPKEAPSFNNWECANLGSSSQNEKFRRLMGIKNPAKEGTGKFGGENRNDKKIFRDLEQGFQKARQMHFGGRCFES